MIIIAMCYAAVVQSYYLYWSFSAAELDWNGSQVDS